MSDQLIGTDLQRAKALLDQDGLVAVPTETVYGLAGNGLHPKAVAKIFAAKNRPAFDPMILHTNSLDKIAPLLQRIPSKARKLAEAFWPGPMSLLFGKTDQVPDLVTAGSPKVAVRIPNHPMTLSLLESIDYPLAAPSANPFGYISPTTAAHVVDQLGDKIPYILDGGDCTVGVESTILDVTTNQVVVLRKGGVPIEAIEAVVGKVLVRDHSSSNPTAPGMLKSHYAPRIPLKVRNLKDLPISIDPKRTGILAFRESVPGIDSAHQFVLSEQGDLTEAGRRLFAFLRQLDQLPIDIIYAEWVPEQDLGRAINDKLRRAGAR